MQPWEKRAITTSFLVTSILGASFVFWYWYAVGLTATAAPRATLFVTLMALLHAAVAKLYSARPMPAKARSTDRPKPQSQQSQDDANWSVSPLYGSALKSAGLQIFLCLLLSKLLLDGGDVHRMVLCATFVHVILIGVCIGLRPKSPTSVDLALIRTGFFPLTLLVCGLVFWMRPILHR